AIDMDAVGPHEHAAAEAPDLLSLFVEMMDGVGLRAEATRRRPRRAAVGRPYGLAIPINGDAVGATPRPFLPRQLRPVSHDAIRIGAAVDGLNVSGLGAGAIDGDPAHKRRRK